MKVLITGSTGFIGTKLCARLSGLGHDVVAYDRSGKQALTGFDAVVNLMGAPVAGKRWTEARKNEIHDSRVGGTEKLFAALRASQPKVVVSASAIGIYGDRRNEVLDEDSSSGLGFLADVCRDWEKVTLTPLPGARHVAIRIGVVLGREGGALKELLPIFRSGFGGPIGDGKQWMSWIHVDDLVELIVFALTNDKLSGPVNAVAPNPVRNEEFSQRLGEALGKPSFFRVPKFALRLRFGEMSAIILDSARVLSKKLGGFQFKFTRLEDALANILK